MPKTITISIPDDTYEALRAAGAQAHQSPEEVAAAAVADKFPPNGAVPSTPSSGDTSVADFQRAKEALIAVMRARGNLVDPATLPPYPGVSDLPPYGSPERARLEEEIAAEIGDALERSGLSILDLIERR